MHYRLFSRLAVPWCLLLLFVVPLLAHFQGVSSLRLLFLFPLAALLSNLPPKDLFERCAELPIDQAAWKDFLARYNHDIEATVRRIIGYPGQGRYCYLFDDIMQRFYQRLLENDRRALHALRGVAEGQVRCYLRTIAAGVTYKMIGGEPPSGISLDPSDSGHDGPQRPMQARALRDHTSCNEDAILLHASLDDALARVLHGRNKYRNMLIFKLATLDGFSPSEISRLTCLRMDSHHAIEQLISRTRQKLRTLFKK